MSPIEAEKLDQRVRVLVVEDHPIVRHGLKMLIQNQPDLAVVGGAESIADGVEQAAQLRPQVVVVDLTLPDGSGLDLIQKLHAEQPALPILALSMHDELSYGERALRAGAKGYVMKREAMDKLLTAIRSVLAGNMFLSEKLAAHLAEKVISRPVGLLDNLSDREFEIFCLLAEGLGPTEIGRKLGRSTRTIEAHRGNIKDKLGLKSGTELTRFIAQWAMRHL